MTEIYRTKEVLERVRVSRATLYKWLKEGKVPDVHRDRNNFRIFTNEDIRKILEYKNIVKEPPEVFVCNLTSKSK